jgi:hypothetical protein
MSRLAAQFCVGFEHSFGYPPDDHTVRGPTPAEDLQALVANGTVDVPGELIEFYRHIAEVSLPDLDNGYFIHSANRSKYRRLAGEVIRGKLKSDSVGFEHI